jgi:hypothetical protein
MKRRDLTPELLEVCLQALDRSQSVEEIVACYPALAADLEPLLRTAMHSREAAEMLRVPLAARARSRARFLEAAAHLQSARPVRASPRFGWRPAWSVLLTLIILALSLIFTTFASAKALPGEPLYPLKRAVEEAQLALTTSQERRLSLAETLDERHARDVQTLIERGRIERVEFAGFLERDSNGLWRVNGVNLLLTFDLEAFARSLDGAYVEVRGRIEPLLGVRVESLQLQLLQISGTLKAQSPESLQIDDTQILISPVTQVRGNLHEGQPVVATVVRLEKSRYLALLVQPGRSPAPHRSEVLNTPWAELRSTLSQGVPPGQMRQMQTPPLRLIPLNKTPDRFEVLPKQETHGPQITDDKEAPKSEISQPTSAPKPSKTPKPEESKRIETPPPDNDEDEGD